MTARRFCVGWRAALGAGQMQPAVTPQFAFLNSPTQYLVHVYQVSTGSWFTITGPAAPHLGTEDVARRLRDDAVLHGASAALMAQVPVVDTLPAIRYPLVTTSGRLWLVDGLADTVTHTRGMSTYGPTGRLEGRLFIPDGYQPLAVSDSLLLVTDRESEGSVVRLYRLSHAAP